MVLAVFSKHRASDNNYANDHLYYFLAFIHQKLKKIKLPLT